MYLLSTGCVITLERGKALFLHHQPAFLQVVQSSTATCMIYGSGQLVGISDSNFQRGVVRRLSVRSTTLTSAAFGVFCARVARLFSEKSTDQPMISECKKGAETYGVTSTLSSVFPDQKQRHANHRAQVDIWLLAV